jgi:hypothetical protein
MIHILWAITLCQLVNTEVTTKDDLDCMDPNMSAANSSKIPAIYHVQGIILKTSIFFTYLPPTNLILPRVLCIKGEPLALANIFHSHLCSLNGFDRLPVTDCSWKMDASYSEDFSLLGWHHAVLYVVKHFRICVLHLYPQTQTYEYLQQAPLTYWASVYQATRCPDQIFTIMKTSTLKTGQNIFPSFFTDSNIQKPCLQARTTTKIKSCSTGCA